MKNESIPTIGLVVSGISDGFTVPVCKGAMKAANENGVRLVIIPGKYLDRDLTERKEIAYEYQYNTLFFYARKDNIDAIIISADSIGCYTTSDRIRELIETYKDIPCVLVASKVDGYVSVNYDNEGGIRDAMDYLINHLHLTRIGMIGGPDDNTDARERKKAFFDCLRENGIQFSEKNFAEGTLSRYSKNAFDTLLDQNPDIQAVFCINDDTAIGLYDALYERGLVPGKDVMVFGYDNMILAAQLKPALSSVWADSVRLGEAALDMTLEILAGKKVSSQLLPTKFIRRESFGDKNENRQVNMMGILERNSIDYYFDEIFYRYKYVKTNEAVKRISDCYRKFMELLIELYEADKIEPEKTAEALKAMDLFLEYRAIEYADMENLLNNLEQINFAFMQKELDIDERNLLVSTFSDIYHKIVMVDEQRFGEKITAEEDKQYDMKLFIRNTMQFEKGTDQSYVYLLENLGWLDIKNASIYIFKKPIIHLEHEEFELPDKIYLKAILKNGEAKSILSEYQERDISAIFKSCETDNGHTAQVLLPLFSNQMIYGIILCDMSEKLFENGEFLINQLSAAAKTIELLRTNEKMQRQLEESLITLKENNIVLDTLSKSDVLTGILNRRGFVENATKLLERNRNMGVGTLIAYVDMNNLKIINDRYGHDDGDFSIKTISEILVKVVEEDGIAGRIGGDEFAVIKKYNAEDDGRPFVEEVYDKFRLFNESSSKPYNVTVSVGTYVISTDDNIELKAAMTLADGKLYEEKQHKAKNVAKIIG